MSIEIVPAYNFQEEIRELLTEYTEMLIEGDSDIKNYLELQNYDVELEDLQTKYGLPYGRLYLAYSDKKPAGCIGLKRIDNKNCEVKRLYVRPAFRGRHIGRLLMEQIIREAKEIGYSHMLLDTLPFLQSAIHMYKKQVFMKFPATTTAPWIHQST